MYKVCGSIDFLLDCFCFSKLLEILRSVSRAHVHTHTHTHTHTRAPAGLPGRLLDLRQIKVVDITQSRTKIL